MDIQRYWIVRPGSDKFILNALCVRTQDQMVWAPANRGTLTLQLMASVAQSLYRMRQGSQIACFSCLISDEEDFSCPV
jgi:hypothetical protein